MRGLPPLALVCGLLASASAWATYVVPSGDVAVSHGEGFGQVTTNTDVTFGDSVIASPGGSAKIVYDDGCTVDVKPGQIVNVQATSPCESGAYEASSRFSPTTYVVGAVIVGGVVVTTVILTSQDNDNDKKKNQNNAEPASP